MLLFTPRHHHANTTLQTRPRWSASVAAYSPQNKVELSNGIRTCLRQAPDATPVSAARQTDLKLKRDKVLIGEQESQGWHAIVIFSDSSTSRDE